MRLPRTEDISILICCVIAKEGSVSPVSLSHIAKEHGLSPLFLKKLAGFLKTNAILSSREGVSGGYTLTKSPSDISVWDVISAVSPKSTTENASGIICPVNKKCLPQKIRKRIGDSLEESLSKISIASLI